MFVIKHDIQRKRIGEAYHGLTGVAANVMAAGSPPIGALWCWEEAEFETFLSHSATGQEAEDLELLVVCNLSCQLSPQGASVKA